MKLIIKWNNSVQCSDVLACNHSYEEALQWQCQ